MSTKRKTVNLVPVTGEVPANIGLIIENVNGKASATVKVIAETEEVFPDNALVAVTEPMNAAALVEAGAYVLFNDTEFRKVGAGATGTLAAGKAYLTAPVGVQILKIGGTTGIESVAEKAEKTDGAIYNLQGIRVKTPTAPGLYIINGKVYKF